MTENLAVIFRKYLIQKPKCLPNQSVNSTNTDIVNSEIDAEGFITILFARLIIVHLINVHSDTLRLADFFKNMDSANSEVIVNLVMYNICLMIGTKKFKYGGTYGKV